MKLNIKTKLAILVAILLAPFIAVYLFTFLTFQPNFEEFVRESFNGGWGTITALYYITVLVVANFLWKWLNE